VELYRNSIFVAKSPDVRRFVGKFRKEENRIKGRSYNAINESTKGSRWSLQQLNKSMHDEDAYNGEVWEQKITSVSLASRLHGYLPR